MSDYTYRGVFINEYKPGYYFAVYYSPQGRDDYYQLLQSPARTNMSNEERIEGWLGNTNNIHAEARGVVEVLDSNEFRIRTLNKREAMEYFRKYKKTRDVEIGPI